MQIFPLQIKICVRLILRMRAASTTYLILLDLITIKTSREKLKF
jgi:hypothetical protein